ncbi:MAG: AbrB/MazE/SpoVT family DNA-binding domain-containing protein [Coriobacteriales bacterium]|nr:AbrB/MazE/SpoVT family DNA-binding domain-containing protein [Coriobacteriales bacterium]
MPETLAKPSGSAKIIRITRNRQITIPQEYYKRLRFENDALCVFTDEGILIKPFKPVRARPSLAEIIDNWQGDYDQELIDWGTDVGKERVM